MHILPSLRCTCYLVARYIWLPSCKMYLVTSMRNAHDYLSARYTCYLIARCVWLPLCKMCLVTLIQDVTVAASKKVDVNSLIFMFSFDRDIIHAYSGGIVACSLWVYNPNHFGLKPVAISLWLWSDLYANVYVKCLEWYVVPSMCRVWDGDCIPSLSEQWLAELVTESPGRPKNRP